MFQEKIIVSKEDLAGGCYAILHLIANDHTRALAGKVGEVLLLMNDDEHKKIRSAIANVKMNIIFGREARDNLGLKPELVRKFVSQAMTYSSNPIAVQRSINVREPGYQLSAEDIAEALNGLGIHYIESASLTRMKDKLSEKDTRHFIDHIYKTLEGLGGEDAKKSKLYYDQEMGKLQKFLTREKVREEDKKIIFSKINKLNAVLANGSDGDEKKEASPPQPSLSPSPLTYHVMENSSFGIALNF